MIHRLIATLALSLLLVLPSIATSGTNSWTVMPGTDVKPTAVAVDPANASIIYLAGATGFEQSDTLFIRKTVDGGATWSTVFSLPYPGNFSIDRLLIDPTSASTVYAITASTVNFGAGVFRSTDGGANWSVRNLGMVSVVADAAVDALGNVYAAGTDGHIYKTTDGGGLWNSVYTAASGFVRGEPTIAIDPSNSSIVYLAAGSSIIKTTNAGANWSTFLSPQRITGGIAIDPAATSTLYVGTEVGVYRSTDGGFTLSPRGTGITGTTSSEIQWIVAMPGSSTTLFAGVFFSVFRSLDGGLTWQAANDGLPVINSNTIQFPSTVTQAPSAPGVLYGLVPQAGIFGPGGIYTYGHDASVLPPTCYLSATPTTIDTGASSILSAYCSPAATSYVWSSNTGFSSSASGGTVSPTQTTTYTVQGVNANGISAVQSVTVLTASPRLSGVSTRGKVLTGEDVLIGGFIIDGTTPKKVVIRARGPSLASAGVAGFLADPTLRVQRSGFVNPLATNDNWGTASNAAELQASGLAPSDAAESAILITLDPGGYTAIVSGVGDTTGVGIVEVYEVDHPETPMVGISTRGKVLTGDDVLIGGFVIEGSSPRQFVVRGRGPSLQSAGVQGALQDPTLEIYSGQTLVASNDNWLTDANAQQLQSSGFAPSDQREAAMLITLGPGPYTVIVKGAGGTTGVAIVEMFEP